MKFNIRTYQPDYALELVYLVFLKIVSNEEEFTFRYVLGSIKTFETDFATLKRQILNMLANVERIEKVVQKRLDEGDVVVIND